MNTDDIGGVYVKYEIEKKLVERKNMFYKKTKSCKYQRSPLCNMYCVLIAHMHFARMNQGKFVNGNKQASSESM